MQESKHYGSTSSVLQSGELGLHENEMKLLNKYKIIIKLNYPIDEKIYSKVAQSILKI